MPSNRKFKAKKTQENLRLSSTPEDATAKRVTVKRSIVNASRVELSVETYASV